MEEIYEALERLNKEKNELKTSKEYKIGHAIKKYCKCIMKFKYKQLINDIKNKKAKNIITKKYYHPTNSEIKENEIDYKKVKIAIYTCILGGYDNIQIPLVKFDNVDYYIFTDEIEKYKGYNNIYNVVKIPEKIQNNGNIIANRYIKFHPSEFFKSYDYAIYMDGNVRIVSDIRTFVKRCSIKTGIAMHTHRERNCIYEEAQVCKLLRRGNKNKIDQQIKQYREEGFPAKFGMNEATIIVSDLKNNEASRLLLEWYNEFVKSQSLRDQLAWPYVLWKNNYKIEDVGNLGNDIYKNYKVEMVRHDDSN